MNLCALFDVLGKLIKDIIAKPQNSNRARMKGNLKLFYSANIT